MSKMIVFRDFNGKSLSGYISLHRGEELETTIKDYREFVCLPDKTIIVAVYSQYYIEHFSRDDDGQGLLRGDFTYKISQTEFSNEQQEILRKDWNKYLLPYKETLLFNNNFYEAPIEDLKNILSSLKIEV